MEIRDSEKFARLIIVQILLTLIATVFTLVIGIWLFNLLIYGTNTKQFVFPENDSLISIGTTVFIIYIFLFIKLTTYRVVPRKNP